MAGKFGSVLVTGGAGYIGCKLAELLLAKGYSVRVLDALFFGERGIAHLLGNENFELIEGRIENADTLRKAVSGVDAVVHLAGLANDPSCDISPQMTKLMNYDATVKLLKLSKEAGVSRFIYGSSASIYGTGSEEALSEDSPLKPVSLYAKYRVKCETAVFSSDSADFDTCCMRKATVFGYSQRLRLDLVVNAMTAHSINKGELTLIGGKQWRPNLQVGDAAGAYVAALEAPSGRIKKEAFNVGSNSANHRIEDIANLVAGAIPGTKILRKPAVDSISYNLSFDKLNKVLKFKANAGVAQGIAEIADAFKSGLVPDYEDAVYYNLRQMQKLLEAGIVG